MRTSRKIKASRKSKIPKRRMLNVSRNRKALKTQKGGSVKTPALTKQETPEMRVEHIAREKLEKKEREKDSNIYMLEKIKTSQILTEYPAVLALIEKIFAGDNIEYFKLDGAVPDPFIKLADKDGFTPQFYLDWYKSKNPEFKTHKEMERVRIDFNTYITDFDGNTYSIYETAIAQICRDILIMLQTGKRNMNNNARKPLDFFKKKQTEITDFFERYNITFTQKMKNSPKFKEKHNKFITNLPIVKDTIELLEKLEPTTENIATINLAKNTLELQKENDLKINSSALDLGKLLDQCEN
jgi:hypothetical protein